MNLNPLSLEIGLYYSLTQFQSALDEPSYTIHLTIKKLTMTNHNNEHSNTFLSENKNGEKLIKFSLIPPSLELKGYEMADVNSLTRKFLWIVLIFFALWVSAMVCFKDSLMFLTTIFMSKLSLKNKSP